MLSFSFATYVILFLDILFNTQSYVTLFLLCKSLVLAVKKIEWISFVNIVCLLTSSTMTRHEIQGHLENTIRLWFDEEKAFHTQTFLLLLDTTLFGYNISKLPFYRISRLFHSWIILIVESYNLLWFDLILSISIKRKMH